MGWGGGGGGVALGNSLISPGICMIRVCYALRIKKPSQGMINIGIKFPKRISGSLCGLKSAINSEVSYMYDKQLSFLNQNM